MTQFAFVYIVYRFFYRIFMFLRNWYAGGFLFVSHHALSLLESLERTFAFHVTLRHFFDPLYQDHTVIGHALGFVFRTVRLAGGAAIYFLVLFAAVLIYLGWAAFPIVVAYRGFF